LRLADADAASQVRRLDKHRVRQRSFDPGKAVVGIARHAAWQHVSHLETGRQTDAWRPLCPCRTRWPALPNQHREGQPSPACLHGAVLAVGPIDGKITSICGSAWPVSHAAAGPSQLVIGACAAGKFPPCSVQHTLVLALSRAWRLFVAASAPGGVMPMGTPCPASRASMTFFALASDTHVRCCVRQTERPRICGLIVSFTNSLFIQGPMPTNLPVPGTPKRS
jgi:hypothetical protein